MNELTAPTRFIIWIIGAVISLGLIGSLGSLTYKAAELAAEAQQRDQMSWGKFSRQLWSQQHKKR